MTVTSGGESGKHRARTPDMEIPGQDQIRSYLDLELELARLKLTKKNIYIYIYIHTHTPKAKIRHNCICLYKQ